MASATSQPLPDFTPSDWYHPNYVNPDVKGHYMLAVMIILMTLSGSIMVLRLISRGYVLRSLGLDDWIMIPSLVTAFALSILELHTLKFGWGRHLWDVQPDEWVIIRKLLFATQILFTISIGLTKVSICVFYYRFRTTKMFRWAISITLGLVLSWQVAMIITIIFQCHPVQGYWKEILLVENRSGCLPNENEIILLHGILNVIFDILVLLLPIPVVLKLQLPKKQKIGLIAMFGLGVIVSGAGILRIISINEVSSNLDASWYGYNLWIYTSTEAHVAIICASVPSLKPLIAKIFPRFASSTYGKGTSGMISTPYRENDGGFGASRRGYPLSSIVTSKHDRLGSEEYILDPENPNIEAKGVVKTTEIQITVHRDQPFR